MTVLGSNPRARVDPNHPEAFAICERCGFLYNHNALRWQYEWRGNQLTNTRHLVCSPCYDVPFELNRPQWAAQEEGTGPNSGDVIQQLIDDGQVP